VVYINIYRHQGMALDRGCTGILPRGDRCRVIVPALAKRCAARTSRTWRPHYLPVPTFSDTLEMTLTSCLEGVVAMWTGVNTFCAISLVLTCGGGVRIWLAWFRQGYLTPQQEYLAWVSGAIVLNVFAIVGSHRLSTAACVMLALVSLSMSARGCWVRYARRPR
jgi:hypothetical protein